MLALASMEMRVHTFISSSQIKSLSTKFRQTFKLIFFHEQFFRQKIEYCNLKKDFFSLI